MDGELYVTSQGDTWDTIALEAYGDEAHADHVMQNNYWCLDILVFPAGVTINTPALPEDDGLDTSGDDGTYAEDDDPYAEGEE